MTSPPDDFQSSWQKEREHCVVWWRWFVGRGRTFWWRWNIFCMDHQCSRNRRVLVELTQKLHYFSYKTHSASSNIRCDLTCERIWNFEKGRHVHERWLVGYEPCWVWMKIFEAGTMVFLCMIEVKHFCWIWNQFSIGGQQFEIVLLKPIEHLCHDTLIGRYK